MKYKRLRRHREIGEIQSGHQRKSTRRKIILGLSTAVIFCTTYALILPAITVETDKAAESAVLEAAAREDGLTVGDNAPIETEGSLTVTAPEGTPNPPEPDKADTKKAEIKLDNELTYENERISAAIHVSGKAAPAGENAAALDAESLEMKISRIDKADSAYKELEQAAAEGSETGEMAALEAMKIELYAGETALDLSGCDITGTITPKSSVTDAAMSAARQTDAAAEAEVGIVLSSIAAAASVPQIVDSGVMLEGDNEPPTLKLKLKNSSAFAVRVSNLPNPQFTVQYYANFDEMQIDNGDNGMEVIDTDKGGNNEGGNLPKNGSYDDGVNNRPTNPVQTKKLKMKEIKPNNPNGLGGIFEVYTAKSLEPIFNEESYKYFNKPGLKYFNKLYGNTSYKLSEIWILIDGNDKNSTDPSDWIKYNPGDIHFTNREESAGGNTVLIDEDTVIRLVYDTKEANFSAPVTFYDYDISDGKFYTSSSLNSTYTTQADAGNSTVYASTREQGINSSVNYTGSGSKLAFGNGNQGTGLGAEQWNKNNINQANQPGTSLKAQGGYGKCCFGIAKKLDEKGNIVFNDGIAAPDLFSNNPTTGKTVLDDRELNFDRVGDTYTLRSVSGTKVDNCHQLMKGTMWYASSYTGIRYKKWTNDFWPADSASYWNENDLKPNHDLVFGDTNKVSSRQFVGDTNGTLYPSDDGLDHNSFFGMHYEVKFSLEDGYVGPLDYLFVGDDDMWVFLDGKLVCDIGGVHSSVGEYVNLWDWLEKGADTKEHTLSFFYTERGSAGSTCYMRFTLPSVSGITPEYDSGSLRIEKEVTGKTDEAVENEEFTFKIKLTDNNGTALPDDYSYTKFYKDGTESNELVISDGTEFTLKNGEYIIIKYLPIGAKYEITETAADGYHTTVQTNNSEPQDSPTAKGEIKNTETTVRYINSTSCMLPETGGGGAGGYIVSGIALMAIAVLIYIKNRKKAVQR